MDTCAYCGKYILKNQTYYYDKKNKSGHFCSRSCFYSNQEREKEESRIRHGNNMDKIYGACTCYVCGKTVSHIDAFNDIYCSRLCYLAMQEANGETMRAWEIAESWGIKVDRGNTKWLFGSAFEEEKLSAKSKVETTEQNVKKEDLEQEKESSIKPEEPEGTITPKGFRYLKFQQFCELTIPNQEKIDAKMVSENTISVHLPALVNNKNEKANSSVMRVYTNHNHDLDGKHYAPNLLYQSEIINLEPGEKIDSKEITINLSEKLKNGIYLIVQILYPEFNGYSRRLYWKQLYSEAFMFRNSELVNYKVIFEEERQVLIAQREVEKKELETAASDISTRMNLYDQQLELRVMQKKILPEILDFRCDYYRKSQSEIFIDLIVSFTGMVKQNELFPDLRIVLYAVDENGDELFSRAFDNLCFQQVVDEDYVVRTISEDGISSLKFNFPGSSTDSVLCIFQKKNGDKWETLFDDGCDLSKFKINT